MSREIKFIVTAKRPSGEIINVVLTINELLDKGLKCGDDSEIINVRQFTGLHDVNGVEIYEGDIVEVFSDGEFAFNHEVKWHDEHGCYVIDAIHGCDYDYTTMPWAMESQYYSYKVIGNIHQNPELLQQ